MKVRKPAGNQYSTACVYLSLFFTGTFYVKSWDKWFQKSPKKTFFHPGWVHGCIFSITKTFGHWGFPLGVWRARWFLGRPSDGIFIGLGKSLARLSSWWKGLLSVSQHRRSPRRSVVFGSIGGRDAKPVDVAKSKQQLFSPINNLSTLVRISWYK